MARSQPMRWRSKACSFGVAAKHTLRRGKHELATVQASCAGGWFWYARNDELGVRRWNTSSDPNRDLDHAKAAATRYVRAELLSSGGKPR